MIRAIREYDIGTRFQQIRSCYVNMGKGEESARLFIHSDTPNLDPWSESMAFPTDTLKITLMTESGKRLWTRDLGGGLIPGIWFSPFVSLDLDGDGVDELYMLGNNRPEHPFTLENRTLERRDAKTGEVTGSWKWPALPAHETLSHTYRYYLVVGHVHGEPVLVCNQGTYGDMHLQCYGKDMKLLWKKAVLDAEPGPRAAHHTLVFDCNKDGVEELLFGERIFSLEDGRELACGDRESFHAHSDIVAPFINPGSGELCYFTCREGQNTEGTARVVTYDKDMNAMWRFFEGGHMHNGWVAFRGRNENPIAMAMSLTKGGADCHESPKIYYYFDAVTGEKTEAPLPFDGDSLFPVDINGDGISEFFRRNGEILDRSGNCIGTIKGRIMTFGSILPGMNGKQIMTSIEEENKVMIFADTEAKNESPDLYPELAENRRHMTASGYNHIFGAFGI